MFCVLIRITSSQHTIINVKIKTTLNCPKYDVCNYGMISKGLKNVFETAVVNEPTVFEPMKFYCSIKNENLHHNFKNRYHRYGNVD